MCYSLIVGDYFYLFSDNTFHSHDWYAEYDVKIGLPTKPGERLSSPTWQREYEKALVVVNLPGANSDHIAQPRTVARKALTGQTGETFAIPVGDGRVLVMED